MPGPPVRQDGSIALKAHPAVAPVIVNRHCYLHDIDDPTCPLNARYRWRLDAWRRVADQLIMYEYYMHGFDTPRVPVPVTWQVGPRIRYYRDMGFIGYAGEILARWPDNDLTLYVAGRMLWDADQDAEAAGYGHGLARLAGRQRHDRIADPRRQVAQLDGSEVA